MNLILTKVNTIHSDYLELKKCLNMEVYYCMHEQKNKMLSELFKSKDLIKPTIQMLEVAAYQGYINAMKILISVGKFKLSAITTDWSLPLDLELVQMAIDENLNSRVSFPYLHLNCCAHQATKKHRNDILQLIYEKTNIASNEYYTNRIAVTATKYKNTEGLFIVLSNTKNVSQEVINWIETGGNQYGPNFTNEIQSAYSDI